MNIKFQTISTLIFLSLTHLTAQKIFEINKVPIVDVHSHFKNRDMQQHAVDQLEDWAGTLYIDLGDKWNSQGEAWGALDTELKVADLDFMQTTLGGHVIPGTADYNLTDGIWASVEQIHGYAATGIAGFKMWPQYEIPVSEIEEIDEKLEAFGEAGLPIIGMHVANPPEGNWHDPEKYMVYQKDAEEVIRRHPGTTFIMAHGFWLMTNDSSLDTLAMFFNRNPNLNAEIAAVSQYWDAPQPTHSKLRDFFIKYRDRLLFGSDVKGQTAQSWIREREFLETNNENIGTFFNGPGPYTGLNLPLDVLNDLYFRNAARLIPAVKKALIDLGYAESDLLPPDTVPIAAGGPWPFNQSTTEKIPPPEIRIFGGEIQIKKRDSKLAAVLVTDLRGKTIDHRVVTRNNWVNLGSGQLAPGLYFIRYKSAGLHSLEKIYYPSGGKYSDPSGF